MPAFPCLLEHCVFRQWDLFPKDRGREVKFLVSVFTCMSCVCPFHTGVESCVPYETKQVSWSVRLLSWVIGMECSACRRMPFRVCQLSWAPFPFRAASHRILSTLKKSVPKLSLSSDSPCSATCLSLSPQDLDWMSLVHGHYSKAAADYHVSAWPSPWPADAVILIIRYDSRCLAVPAWEPEGYY